jgi:hypothetical protein
MFVLVTVPGEAPYSPRPTRCLRRHRHFLQCAPQCSRRQHFVANIHTPKTPQDNEPIDGVTGIIDFGGDRHVPLNKPVVILRVNNGEVDPSKMVICGTVNGQTNPAWCPTDPNQ